MALGSVITLFAAAPSSTNYTLKQYDFGTGGGVGTSTNYKLDALSGGQAAGPLTSTNYRVNPGELATQQANVPPAPTFTNPDSSYNRLRLSLSTGSNPSDVKFAIAISDDDFVSTQYVQNDNAAGPALGAEDYQTYAGWGGAGGFWVLGLKPSTTYKVKVKAFQEDFTETGYGPTATAATVQTSVTFGLVTTQSATPPFTVSFGSLALSTVTSADADAVLSLSSNALYGGVIYLKGSNGGLYSISQNFTVSSVTADLAAANQGYGGQVISVSQSAGGPLSSVTPFDGGSDNVGSLSTNLQRLVVTPAPITGGSATVRFKTKIGSEVLAGTDYSDTLTFVAAMLF